MGLICEYLIKAIRAAAVYNPDVQVAPSCILWPDKDRQWEPIISTLMAEIPELLILGDYKPESKTGPGIWLRCVIAEKIDDIEIIRGKPPIIYLPGVSRQDLRAVESCPDYLRPLAELQYRGIIWSQINAKDWTILAFLKSDQGGLGLDAALDNEAKQAMQLALPRLLDMDIELLRDKRLDKDYFNTLLTGDPVRELLQWLDQGDAFREARSESEWNAFVQVCKSKFVFHPENDGSLIGAGRLAAHDGPWHGVWERFCEAPKRYMYIPDLIRKTNPPHDLFTDKSGWPQANDEQEASLRKDLQALEKDPAHIARAKLIDYESKHKERRGLVWAEIGYSPLANAMEHLAVLAEVTGNPLAAGSIDDITAGYTSNGWKGDDAVIRALACVEKHDDFKAVKSAIRAIYMPWVEESAKHLQSIAQKGNYPKKSAATDKKISYKKNECVLFIDGLRYDTAKRLEDILSERDCKITSTVQWAALPSVTATGKPACTPVRNKIKGEETSADFEPCVAESGQSLMGGYHLKKLLMDSEWSVLERSSEGNNSKNAWSEAGNIDHEGHDRGWKLARHIEGVLREITDRVEQMLNDGWKIIRIVTDHGWLLVPGGLPKVDVPKALTENKWGRCASIKPGAVTDELLYPWYWNEDQSFASAHGISCYKNGQEYAHGGLSLQECLTLELIVTQGYGKGKIQKIDITDVVWKGLRCSIAVDGDISNLKADIRKQPGNASTSVVLSTKPFKANAVSSLVVENEGLEGSKAVVVVMNENNEIVAQSATVIGGGDS